MQAYLLKGLELAATTYGRLLDAIPPARLDESMGDGRFSPREVIAHVADFEPIFLERCKVAISTPGAVVPLRDESQMAIDNRYAESDVQERLKAFQSARAATVDFLRNLTSDEHKRDFTHPLHGRITLADMAGMVSGHDHYHLEQLSAFLGEKKAGTW